MTRKAQAMSEMANERRVHGALEAILMVSATPVPAEQLAAVLGMPVSNVREALELLAQAYRDQGRGFELRELGQGWRFYSHPDYADEVEAFVRDGQTARLKIGRASCRARG